MKKIIIVLTITLLVSSLLADFSYTGSMRTRMTAWNTLIEDDSPTGSWIDSRIRIKFVEKVDENFSATVRFEMGDMKWGDGNATNIGTDGKIIELKHAFANFTCPMGGKITIGLQGWADARGLVFDDDFAAIMRSGKIGMLDTQFGFAKVDEGMYDADDDIDMFLLNFGMGMFKMDNIIGRSNAGKDLDMWFMPSATVATDALELNAMLAINSCSYDEGDVTNFGYALSLNVATKNLPLDLGVDLLMTSGDDGEDTESTTVFNTISGYYINGLELMGYGINDGIGETNVGNNGAGSMDIVITASKEIMPSLKVKGAFGMLNNIEGDETSKGMEIDAGISKKLHDKISFDLVGAFFMPNKDFWGSDEMVKEISSRISYKF